MSPYFDGVLEGLGFLTTLLIASYIVYKFWPEAK